MVGNNRHLSSRSSAVDITSKIPALQQRIRQSHAILRRNRTVLATADRMMIASWVGLFESLGPLVGAATSEADALLCLESCGADLLICTDLLDSGSGPSLVSRAKQANPQLKVLMLVQRPVLRTLMAAINAGCDGLCAKDLVGNGNLLAALQAMESDGTYLDRMVTGVLGHSHLRREVLSNPVDLSRREDDVLRGLCKGMCNQAIADELHLSIDTVKTYMKNLLQKLDAQDRTHAVVVAFRDGLVELPPSAPGWH